MTPSPRRRPVARALLWAGGAAALAATFVAYLDPEMAFALATRAWACF